MHTCPECGQACYCHGDIDDIDANPMDGPPFCEHACQVDGDEDGPDFYDGDEPEDGADCSADLPGGMTRQECLDGLFEMRDEWYKAIKRKDPGFVRYPDLDNLLDHIKNHGFPPPPNATAQATQTNL